MSVSELPTNYNIVSEGDGSPPPQSENQQKLKIMNTKLKELIKNYEKEISHFRNQISGLDVELQRIKDDYGSHSIDFEITIRDNNYYQTLYGSRISTLTKVIKDLEFLLTLNEKVECK